jgi:hypothetical protein
MHTILLHSSFSKLSNELIALIQNAPFNIQTLTNMSLVSVDTKLIRSKLKKSTSISVKVVPCILVVHPDGVVVQYDGRRCFDFINDIISSKQEEIAPPPLPSPVPPSPPTPSPEEPHHVSFDLPPNVTDINSIPEPSLAQIPITRPSAERRTNIEDLKSEDGSEDAAFGLPVEQIRRPRMSIRSDEGNYEVLGDSDVGIPMDESNRKVVRGIKGSDDKKSTALSVAQSMQKERERDMELVGPPPII